MSGRDGFGRLVHAEWTKLRTVRGWVIGLVVAAFLTVGFGMLGPMGSQIACDHVNDAPTHSCHMSGPPKDATGQEVDDRSTFVHRTLTGDGSITARLTAFGGLYSPDGGGPADATSPTAGMTSGLQPWSKAGILVKDGTATGSAYAAVLATGTHGVRMQYDYTHDTAGPNVAVTSGAPRWLRLTRAGDTLTGYESADGATWTEIGTADLANLPQSVQVGVFATSPDFAVVKSSFGGSSTNTGPSLATGTFDQIAVTGQTAGDWTVPAIGSAAAADGGPGALQGPEAVAGAVPSGTGGFTVTGTGDIAPSAPGEGAGKTPESSLAGTFGGLIAVIVVAALTMTSEYRRGLIRTSLAASPRRGRLLAAKAVVLGAVSFVVGLVAAAIAVPAVTAVEHSKRLYVYYASTQTEIRMVVGTAALLAVSAVFALAVATIVRRGAAAVAAVIVAIILPYILAVASVLPAGAAQWLARVTPAAAFAVQQTVTAWPQVSASYTPTNGYFPLSPWAGLGVLCLYAAVAYAVAHRLLHRRDA
ncbi:ABC transporter permease subunit [Catenulispora sp. NF23]|uniref:ABC transporter permease subunit n=1 Tax=Catenulispora pinistramenti TaxID=2705254 RepID=UPI001BA81FBB|nr:ABC transporter permease subunit [Catenulispora pinistramenti]MBS2533571.1 ABC transporter permease subunit [Catenulispora pinistramenti]